METNTRTYWQIEHKNGQSAWAQQSQRWPSLEEAEDIINRQRWNARLAYIKDAEYRIVKVTEAREVSAERWDEKKKSSFERMSELLNDVISSTVDAGTYPDGPCIEKELRDKIKEELKLNK